MPMQYIDGFIQQYYPIFAGFMVDYKEQVVLTEVKSGQYCIIYYILSYKRGDLLSTISSKWPR
jgi:hypothetical protein